MARYEGEMEGATIIRSTFEEIGLEDVGINKFELPDWWRGSSGITTPDRGRRLAAGHEIIARIGAPSGEVTGEEVELGYGLHADFETADVEERIAMIRSDSPW